MSVTICFAYTSPALASGGPASPNIREARAAVRNGRSGGSTRSHIGSRSQMRFAPTL